MGFPIWQQSYGVSFSSMDSIKALVETSDGDYLAAGSTSPTGFATDGWLLRVNQDGLVEWQRTYSLGSTSSELANALALTSDDGALLAGWTSSGGDRQALVWRVDATGNLQWAHTYGQGGMSKVARAILASPDGGAVVAGDKYVFASQNLDAWVMKLDASGTSEWQKVYGSSQNHEQANGLVESSDGSYVVVGEVMTPNTAPPDDGWLMKFTDTGGNTSCVGSRQPVALQVAVAVPFFMPYVVAPEAVVFTRTTSTALQKSPVSAVCQ
jgi:hypothetical protein